MMKADNVGVHYGAIQAVYGVSLEINAGGFVLILGPNGAGKTSFISALAGIVPCSAGKIVLDGADVTHVSATRRVRLGVSLVPEGRGVLKGLSVKENLLLGWHASAKERRGSFSTGLGEVTEIFPRLSERLEQDCSTLSGGEMQMLAVARAMLARPKVILLDEPSLGLAPLAVKAVYAALRRLSELGMTLVVVEQKNVPITSVPDRTLVMREGEVLLDMADGRPSEAELAELYLGGRR
jgi:branched-chain amino acid transport system ATP-binding protein